MSIIKASFLIFIFALLIVYYCVPKKAQWIVLLIGSAVFYLFSGAKTSIYILITASSVYGAALWMESLAAKRRAYLKENKSLSREEKSAYKQSVQKKRRAVMLACLLVNLGLLCVFKYLHFAVDSINALLSAVGIMPLENSFTLIVPLGISFYTFQSIGYLVDVYWENIAPQRNYLRMLLFVSFFPQITQGPISDYQQLSGELFAEHSFTYRNFSRGFQRLLFGLMKKMVLANLLQPYITSIFTNYAKYTGITVFLGVFAYSVQLYADFSGYMDIMCGACEMLDIRLTENFVRPYFSRSVAEYWRRWHISLGAWFKKYVYYPIAVAKWNQKLGKKVQAKLGRTAAKNLPATVALIVTWFCTGLWHGASWAYIAWGGVNGFFLILSMWMEPVYAKCKSALRIDESARLWRLFQVARSFFLIMFIKVLPDVGTLGDGLRLISRVFTNHQIPRTLNALIPFSSKWAFFPGVVIAFILMFADDLIARRRDVRDLFGKLPTAARVALLVLLFFLIAAFGIPASNNMRGFMYAQF